MGIELSKCHETLLYCCCATEMRALRRRKAVHVHYNSRLLQIIDPILDPRNVKKAHGATEQSFWLKMVG